MVFEVDVRKRIAIGNVSNDPYICGNSGDVIKFTFDKEWEQHEKKVARLSWNSKFIDVEFEGTQVEIPGKVITNAHIFTVGVYVEGASGEVLLRTTTAASIPCKPSALCGDAKPSEENDKHYANEAREYAEEAREAADEAKEYSAKPPKIGDNGNWWCWNGSQYIDSGLPSRGEPGAEGLKGDDYILTEANKEEIADIVIEKLPIYYGEVE